MGREIKINVYNYKNVIKCQNCLIGKFASVCQLSSLSMISIYCNVNNTDGI